MPRDAGPVKGGSSVIAFVEDPTGEIQGFVAALHVRQVRESRPIAWMLNVCCTQDAAALVHQMTHWLHAHL